ncbi:MAG TPA: efflux RND transporter periplasmic adaptor subunit, partial [Myxococcota bacterium]|nr:efflux RND transporter periplasmic adaptor subunit [Myxococcota bacterium]
MTTREIARAAVRSLLLIALAAALAACASKASPPSADAGPRERPKTVEPWTVAEQDFERSIEITADVLPRSSVILFSKLPGDVTRVHVVEGDRVKAGQALVELDRSDYLLGLRQAEAQLAAAKAGLSVADIGVGTVSKKYERFAVLHQNQSLSDNEFEDISSAREQGLAGQQGARAQLAMAEVGLDAARVNLSRTTIRAPFDGVVVQRMVDEGTRLHAMPPSPVVMIADLDRVEVIGSVGQQDLLGIERGTKVEIVVDALSPEPIPATVDRLEPMVDPRTRTAKVKVYIDNPPYPGQPGKRVHPGMSARMILRLGSHKSPCVPDDALAKLSAAERKAVLFVLKNDLAVRREVSLGARSGELLQIL